MAHDTQKEKRRFIEFSNLFVDYTEGDVVIFDKVQDLRDLYPLKSMTNLIALCTDGKAKVGTNDIMVDVTKGDILFCPPNITIRRQNDSEHFSCKVLCLSDHIIQGLLRDKSDVWHRAVYTNKLNVIGLTNVSQEEFHFYYALIQSKIQKRDKQTPYEIVQALIRALLLELCYLFADIDTDSLGEKKMSQGKILFHKFLNLISVNDVKRQPITLYASQLAITPKYLTMLCLKYSDKTASEWVIQYTIEDIRFYLRNSNLSIKEISAKLGFANMSHFGSYVRKHLGMSPSEFRENQ